MSQVEDLSRKLGHMAAQWATLWSGHARATPLTQSLYAAYREAQSNAYAGARDLAAARRNLQADVRLPAKGRRELLKQAEEKASKRLDSAFRQMGAASAAIRQELKRASLPRPPADTGRESMLRDEVAMIVRAAPEPVAALTDLAAGDDELAGVAVSSYGESLLRGLGVAKARERIEQVRETVALGAADSKNSTRATAGKALRDHGRLEQLTVVTRSGVEDILEGREGPAGDPAPGGSSARGGGADWTDSGKVVGGGDPYAA